MHATTNASALINFNPVTFWGQRAADLGEQSESILLLWMRNLAFDKGNLPKDVRNLIEGEIALLEVCDLWRTTGLAPVSDMSRFTYAMDAVFRIDRDILVAFMKRVR